MSFIVNKLDEQRLIADADLHSERAKRIRLVGDLTYLLGPALTALQAGRSEVVKDRLERALLALRGAE